MSDSATDPAGLVQRNLDRLAGNYPALGLAVSGGGDSMAMMHFAARWTQGRRIMVATVDHGLRPESVDEAKQVRLAAEALGMRHETLRWQRDGDAGNLMAAAREARLDLLSEWAARNDLPAIAVAHTSDDQAETLMMRLMRGSGLHGLAGMAEARKAYGINWIRPMLGISRQNLRNWLAAHSIEWIDDPSNENRTFDRIRIRKTMAELGLDTAALARSADHLREARDALASLAANAAQGATANNGVLHLPRQPYVDAPAEIRRRLLIAGCRWITGAAYPPRRATVLHAMEAVAAGDRVTLDGALIETAREEIVFRREPAAAMRGPDSAGPDWDNRWRILGLQQDEYIRAIGYDLLADLNWRESGLARDEAAACPAIWCNRGLISTPTLDKSAEHRAIPLRDASDFRSMVMLH